MISVKKSKSTQNIVSLFRILIEYNAILPTEAAKFGVSIFISQ